jgi:enoyl-CoA hydratase/carnithine racemase
MELRATAYRVEGHVAVIELSRPARRNAWTGRMHTEFRWCALEAERDPSVRVVVLQGDPTGGAFCVGADTEALAGHVERGGYDDGLRGEVASPGSGVHPFTDAHFAWQLALRVPIIAAINGACAGVGLAAAAFCDVRFVARDAVLTTAASKLGLPAEYGLSWLLPRLVSRLHATDLLLSGRRFRGSEAEAMGFAFGCDDAAATVEAAHAYAQSLATSVSPHSVTITKRQLLEDLLRHDVGASVRDADRLLSEAMRGPDYREGVAALREKRPPDF